MFCLCGFRRANWYPRFQRVKYDIVFSTHYAAFSVFRGEFYFVYFNFDFTNYFCDFQNILTEDVVKSPTTCLCKVCWGNLEQFNEFYSFVAANYQIEIKEVKYQIPDSEMVTAEHSDMIVYDDGDKAETEMIKVEIINDTEHFEETSDWLEEEEEAPSRRKKPKRILTIDPPKLSRQSTTVLDSADDQRIRETAMMSCDICSESVDSLRDAKAHFKVSLSSTIS